MSDRGLSPAVIWLIIGLLVMVYIYSVNPLITRESFFNFRPGYPVKQLRTMPLTSPLPELSGPADATLDSPRTPYNLLGDYMAPGEGRLANFKSECAYIADGERLIEKTGSYGQVTNNYKRKNPDNGSTLLHELSVSFYRL
jgi:hypothetical protein